MKNERLTLTICTALLLTGAELSAMENDSAAASTDGRSYFIVNQDVDDFFKDLSRDTQTRFQTSSKVRGRLEAASLSGNVSEIMTDVAATLDLDWFEYNSVIFVSDRDEALTRMIRLGDLGLQDALNELENSGLLFDDFPITAAAENSALLVTGPPQFLALVESVIEGIPSEITPTETRRTRTILVRRGTETTNEVIR